MRESTRLLLIAGIAGLCGLGAALWMKSPGPIWGNESGQRLLQTALERPAPAGIASARRGQPVPPVALKTLDGEATALPLPAGKITLINVWASWCSPCIQEMPLLAEFAKSQNPDGIQVIGIALDEAEAVQAWLSRMPSPYPHYLDTPGQRDASVLLGNSAGVLPYTVLIDAEGRLLKQRIGPFSSVQDVFQWSRASL
ncbi:alkyl hydroperoxide reductase [Lysobacteraceae bacterium NML95-0200]|nr:alkyl hydroperoxide reductase [Xanthomonadaceae bacterium NML95-0200]